MSTQARPVGNMLKNDGEEQIIANDSFGAVLSSIAFVEHFGAGNNPALMLGISDPESMCSDCESGDVTEALMLLTVGKAKALREHLDAFITKHEQKGQVSP